VWGADAFEYANPTVLSGGGVMMFARSVDAVRMNYKESSALRPPLRGAYA